MVYLKFLSNKTLDNRSQRLITLRYALAEGKSKYAYSAVPKTMIPIMF